MFTVAQVLLLPGKLHWPSL